MTTMSERQSYLQFDLFLQISLIIFLDGFHYSLTARGEQTE